MADVELAILLQALLQIGKRLRIQLPDVILGIS